MTDALEIMELRTYRAATMQEALLMVRRELGPDAAVLHTRQVKRGLFRWLGGRGGFEVVASREVQVASRLPAPSEPTHRAARDRLDEAPEPSRRALHDELKS